MNPVSPLLKLALRLAVGGSPGQRWRQVALVLAGLVTAVLALFVVGSANALSRIDEREFARTAIVGETDGASLMLARRVDTWRGEQFPVLYLEPRPDVPELALLPPGLSRLPEPGEAFVSPALAELIDDHPALADRYGRQPAVLPDSALGRKDELLAYLRPPAGRSIAADERSHPIKGYGAEPHTPGTVSVADPSDLPTLPMLLAALALLGVPIGV
ncbi:hypothetical protein O7606_12435 [Micromonospora sp. WMMD882]|uniref:hypothetical protein n=1 Tax=Micromonospora sp. WMMD882 TaxID=3015151 RepID=UPI00248C8066|nr:hypothetical protein [Micromonospora sp. WMMD882]WBB82097.1 hypothetical protein O7606_12435 [Micromonospora sp. WMMD882]